MSESESGTTLQRPYLLRAMHEWMSDNNLTPHIVIDTDKADSSLPLEFAKDGKLVINISYSATQNLLIDNECASFDARFGGASRHLEIPILAILGIYARESGQGMIFSGESESEEHPEALADSDLQAAPSEAAKPENAEGKSERSRPQLKIIK